MKFAPILIVVALALGGWMPPEKVLDAQFVMLIEGDVRPTLVTPRNLETACRKFFSAGVTYLPKGEGKFQLFCELPVNKEFPDNRVYFFFHWEEGSGLQLSFIQQSHEGQKPTFIENDVAAEMVGTLRDKLIDSRIVEKPPEGRDAFSPTFRWCDAATDRNCTPDN